MKKRTKRKPWHERDFEHISCGFPVILKNVLMIPYGKDDAIIAVDHNRFTAAVLCALADKPTRFTGEEIRFLRLHYDMRLAEFGGEFDVTHAAVKKWENRQDAATGMAWTTEVMIRLFVLRRLGVKGRAFQQAYDRLARPRPAGPCTLHLDLDKDPAEIRYDCDPLAEAS